VTVWSGVYGFELVGGPLVAQEIAPGGYMENLYGCAERN
jgi:hypothetical protein